MGQSLHTIAKAYDRVAAEYAKRFSREHDDKPLDRDMLARFSQELAGRRPVWDFGCGPGQTTRYLKDLGLDISGLDLSEKQIGQARRLHPDIAFRRGNLLELDFAENSIAGVVAFYAIVHFTAEQVGTAFREMFRVLQPGGVLLLAYHIGAELMRVHEFLGKKIDIDFMFFETGFISRNLTAAGFGKIETICREPYPEVEYPSQRAYVFARKPPGRHCNEIEGD